VCGVNSIFSSLRFDLLRHHTDKMGRISFILSLLSVTNVIGAQLAGTKWIGEARKEKGVDYQCKCYSDNSCWPSQSKWSSLNRTVDGRLQVAVPPGAVCHRSLDGVQTYDQAACANVQANWLNEQWL
jgi:hypothetical protein